jgi:fatty acid-binding protein DegV
MKILARDIPANAQKLRFGVAHVGHPEILVELSAALRDRWGDVELLTAAASPVIANHVGLGAWAVAYMVED